LLQLS